MRQCESCGMPLDEKHQSKLDSRYCIYCQDQKTGRLATKEEVREGSVKAIMRLERKTREEAEKMVNETMNRLPRWRK